jgi:hypothetical protein
VRTPSRCRRGTYDAELLVSGDGQSLLGPFDLEITAGVVTVVYTVGASVEPELLVVEYEVGETDKADCVPEPTPTPTTAETRTRSHRGLGRRRTSAGAGTGAVGAGTAVLGLITRIHRPPRGCWCLHEARTPGDGPTSYTHSNCSGEA